MADVASRDLRNDLRGVLARVEAGEQVVITVAGRPVARLEPIQGRPRWVRGDQFLARLRQADPDLRAELRRLAPDTTADLREW